MVVYIEACESGSMFDGLLPENINGMNNFKAISNCEIVSNILVWFQVYATTASNGEESSYACYYDDKRQVSFIFIASNMMSQTNKA